MSPATQRTRRHWMQLLCAGAAPPWCRVAHAQGNAEIVKLAGEQHKLLLRADGSVLGWGPMAAGQLGPPAGIAALKGRSTTAVAIALPGRAVDIAAGPATSYAVLEDGSLLAWGSARQGALGQGEDGPERGDGQPQRVPGLQGARQVLAHGGVVLVLLQDGSVRAWGRRTYGRVGDGQHPKRYGDDGVPALSPVPVPGLPPIRQLALGASHVLALDADSRIWSWGSNAEGALGRAPRRELPLDEAAPGPALDDVVQAAAGQGVSTALKRDGSVWVWGANWFGQFGNGERSDPPGVNNGWQLQPQQVPGVAGAVQLSLGITGRHTLARLKDGTLRGWGNTDWGQIGAGKSADFQEKPVTPRISGVKAVFALGNNSAALRSDGSLWFWGLGERGEWPLPGNSAVPVRLALP